jgi:5-methyltetrahydrofolate--homocysteine methyltransferase
MALGTKSFLERAKEKIIIFDGAMGTSLFTYNLSAEDYGGAEFEGCPEMLNIVRPDIIQEIHSKFFLAGADIIETNTFGSSKLVLAEYGIEHRSYEISKLSASLAREVADKFTAQDPLKPRFVAGSIGPGTKLASLGNISFDELYESYQPQVRGLIDGGVDMILIETCQDTLQIKACLNACFKVFRDIEQECENLTDAELACKFPRAVFVDKPRTGLYERIRYPIQVQVTVETMGTMLVGSDIASALTTLRAYPVDAVGMNCATGPKEMKEHIKFLAEHSPGMISCLPNAGIPENVGGHAHFPLDPKNFSEQLSQFAKDFGINIVGGCCGTSYEHIKQLSEKISLLNLPPRISNPQKQLSDECLESIESVSSIYNSVPMIMNPRPLIVGERTNANGSKLFRELLGASDYEAIVDIAKEQVAEGAHVLDVCTAYVGRNELTDMLEIIKRINTQVNIPIMVDSTEYPVLRESLKYISGKPIINSINLEDGEERVAQVAALTNQFGAALVVLTIDEEGMAKTAQRKFEIADRLYKLLVDKHGIDPRNLIYDDLTFTLASGDDDMRNAGYETIEGLRLIKEKYPEVKTILGLSNISFGLDAKLRPALNSVFLNECINAGLDMAIASASKLIPIAQIDPKIKNICLDLIYDRRTQDYDPLHALLACASELKETSSASANAYEGLALEDLLAQRIIDGNKTGIEKDLDKALEAGHKPLDIINEFLMNGMKIVGDRFRTGEMQLPFVLQSATCMKTAVAYLEKFMDKADGTGSKGSIVLATVKGDVHDIGKNLVDIILTNNGYIVYNLGIKQPIEAILEAVEKYKADVVGMSGLLVKSTLIMKHNLEAMNDKGISIPVILGGSALTRRYVEEDCAQAYKGTVFYGFDAFTDLSLMEKICSGVELEKVKKEFYKTKKHEAIPQINPETNSPYDTVVDQKPSLEEALNYTTNLSSIPVLDDQLIPTPPFFGRYRVDSAVIDIDEVWKYINLDALIIGQWRMGKGKMSAEDYENLRQNTIIPIFEKTKQLAREIGYIKPKIIYGYYPCWVDKSNPNKLIINAEGKNYDFIFPRQTRPDYMCLTDFFRTQSDKPNLVAFQIVTIGQETADFVNGLYKDSKFDEYLYHYGLATETTEALAEFAHARIRRELGFSQEDDTDMAKLVRGSYHGLRYSFGYPACPRLEDQIPLFDILKASEIGLELSEEFQIHPEHSTSAIVVHHPSAKYFNI